MTFEQWYSGYGSRLKPGMGYSFEDISRMAWEAATASQQKELERWATCTANLLDAVTTCVDIAPGCAIDEFVKDARKLLVRTTP